MVTTHRNQLCTKKNELMCLILYYSLSLLQGWLHSTNHKNKSCQKDPKRWPQTQVHHSGLQNFDGRSSSTCHFASLFVHLVPGAKMVNKIGSKRLLSTSDLLICLLVYLLTCFLPDFLTFLLFTFLLPSLLASLLTGLAEWIKSIS